ncbi:MAG: RyR domain-containing protein [Pseudomonadota bacterium]
MLKFEWKTILLWLVPSFAILAIITGTWGWHLRGSPTTTFDDALYTSLSAFGLNSSYTNLVLQNEPFHIKALLQISRWSGVIVGFSAVFGALWGLLHAYISRIRAWTGDFPIVLIGDSDLLLPALQLAKGDVRTLRLGAKEIHSDLRSISLPIIGDAETFVKAHIRTSSKILVVANSDSTTLSLARMAQKHAPTAQITAIVRSESVIEAAQTLSDPRIRMLSTCKLVARALHRDNPPFMIAKEIGQKNIHALIVGFGDIGEAIARDLIVNCQTIDLGIPHITIIDPLAKTRQRTLELAIPEFDKTCVFTALEGGFDVDLEPPSLLKKDSPEFTCIYVCLPSDDAALASLGHLSHWLRANGHKSPKIFVRLRDDNLMVAQVANIIEFGAFSNLARESEFLADEPDRGARAYHAAYLKQLKLSEGHNPNNVTAVPWEDLAQTYRSANRTAIAHVPAKLASAGIDPTIWLGARELPQLPTGMSLYEHGDGMKEKLGRLEHERWNAERRLNGWKYGKIKNESLKTHPALVEYDELTEEIQSFDLELVEMIAQMIKS